MLTWPTLLIQAFLAGSVSALPLGPMGILCVRRTLQHGRGAGLWAAAGIAVALGLWGLVVAQGMNLVSPWFAGREAGLRLGVGIVLIVEGWRGLRREPGTTTERTSPVSRWGGFITTLCGVGGNPLTPATLAAVFTVVGLLRVELDGARAAGLVAAIGLGAITLWVGLAEALLRMHRRWGDVVTARLSRGLSGLLLVSGIWLPDDGELRSSAEASRQAKPGIQ